MTAADTPPSPTKPRHFRSLRSKVFLPFFILIISLGAGAIWGSFYLADLSFKNSADQRLAAAHEVLFREFKRQESLLQTYAVIMQQFQAISTRLQNEAEIGILQDRLFNILNESDISIAFFPADIRGLIPQESLVTLFDQVRRSDSARFRYSNEFGGTPVLVVAAPIHDQGKISQILLLRSTMGDAFLRSVTSSLDVAASLLTIEGEVLATSTGQTSKLKLTPAQTNHVGSGKNLYIDYETAKGVERQFFSIIPLGNSDMVLLSLQVSLQETTELQNATILRIVLIMAVFIIISTIIYFRKINTITSPVRELCNASEAISRGNMNYRIAEIPNDELGQIALSFNQMASKLETSYRERANQDIVAALAIEEGKTKLLLEKKERERERINEELHTIQREATALYQLNQAMTASIELNALFDRILQVLNETLACDHIVLLVHNTGESTLEVIRTAGLDAETLGNVRFNFNQGITGEAALSQRMIYVKDVDQDKRNLSYHGQVATRGSLISVPLVVKGRLVGALNLHKKKIDAFPVSEQKLIQAIANQTAIAIDNAHLLEKSRELNDTDELTGLSNRKHFQDILKREVAQARRFSSNFSIVMCDIDGFKKHKSTLGNIHADALLRQVGQTILKNTRGIDLVSRFGNDQFILLLPKTNKAGAVAAAEKLRKRINAEDFFRQINVEKSFDLTISFGVTEFPVDSKNIYELMNLADRALYAAKQDGCNCTVAWEGPAPAPE